MFAENQSCTICSLFDGPYGVVPEGLLTFLRFFRQCGCFLWFCLEKYCLCYPCSGDEGSILEINFNVYAYRREKSGKPIFTVFRRHQRSIGIFLRLTFYEMWHYNTKWSYLKVPEIKSYILSWGHSVFRGKKYFFSGGLSLEARDQSSGSSFATSL